MTKRRLEQLLERELNGELTAIEREELSRLMWTDRRARQEHVAWRRFEGLLGDALGGAPKLDLIRSCAKVMGRAERGKGSSSRSEGVWARLITESFRKAGFGQSLMRILFLGSSALIVALGIWSSFSYSLRERRADPVRETASEPGSSAIAETGGRTGRVSTAAPVQVHFGDPSGDDDRDPRPVTIRF